MTNSNPQGTTVIRNAQETTSSGEFERFESLLSGLVRAPSTPQTKKQQKTKASAQ
jgi:hypothetical protein